MDQSDLAIKLAFKNRQMLKILGISANLRDNLDELGTILDDPYARYLSRTQSLIVSTSTIYCFLNSIFNYKSIVIKMQPFVVKGKPK